MLPSQPIAIKQGSPRRPAIQFSRLPRRGGGFAGSGPTMASDTHTTPSTSLGCVPSLLRQPHDFPTHISGSVSATGSKSRTTVQLFLSIVLRTFAFEAISDYVL